MVSRGGLYGRPYSFGRFYSPAICAIFMFMKRFPLFLILAFVLSGCMSYGPEELDRLTKEDPEFKKMIELRDQIHNDISLIKNDLLSKKKTMDAQSEKLHQEYEIYAKNQNMKIEKMKQVVAAKRDLLNHDIEAASNALGLKETELKGYQDTLDQVRKMLTESKGLNLSSVEKQKWEERTLMLSEKMRPLSDEIQDLKLQIRLKKRKVGFLH